MQKHIVDFDVHVSYAIVVQVQQSIENLNEYVSSYALFHEAGLLDKVEKISTVRALLDHYHRAICGLKGARV